MNLPPEISLSYLTGIPADRSIVDDLPSQKKAYLHKINEILLKAKPDYLDAKVILDVDRQLGDCSAQDVSQKDYDFVDSLEAYFCFNQGKLNEFIARFKIPELAKQAAEQKKEKSVIESVKPSSIPDQQAFDQVFEASTPEQRMQLAKHKFALSSRVFYYLEKPLYFATFSVEQIAKQLCVGDPIADVVRVLPALYHNTAYKEIMPQLLNKEALDQYPYIADACVKFILAEMQFSNELFRLQTELRITDEDLYKHSILGLTTKDKRFVLEDDYRFKFFEVFNKFLTEKDFKNVYACHKAHFEIKCSHEPLRTLALLAFCKGYGKAADVQFAERLDFFQVSPRSNAEALILINRRCKIRNIQVYYTDDEVDYQQLLQIAPNYQEATEYYSDALTEFSVPIKCSTEFYSAIFEVDSIFYQYVHHCKQPHREKKILGANCVKIQGNFKKFSFQNQKGVGSEVDVQFSYFDEHDNCFVKILYQNDSIKEILVQKPTVTPVLQVDVEWEALSAAKFYFLPVYVGHKVFFEGQQKFFQADSFSLKLYASNAKNKRLILSYEVIPADGKIHSFDLDPNVVFYAKELVAEFSARANGQLVKQEHTHAINNDVFLFCKQMVYADKLVYHFFNKSGPITALDVEMIVQYNNVMTGEQRVRKVTDKDGFCDFIPPQEAQIGNITSVRVEVEYCKKYYSIDHSLQQNSSKALYQLYMTADGKIDAALPSDCYLEINGARLYFAAGCARLPDNVKEGEHSVVLFCPGAIPRVVAELHVIRSVSTVDSLLLLVFETPRGLMVPAKCEVDCSMYCSAQYHDAMQYSNEEIPFTDCYDDELKYRVPVPVYLTDNYVYLYSLYQAFYDKYYSASVSSKPPCLFLKERLIDRMPFASKQDFAGRAKRILRGGPDPRYMDCRMDNCEAACYDECAPQLMMCAAPGAYMTRCRAANICLAYTGAPLKHSNGVDPFVKVGSNVYISQAYDMRLVNVLPGGATTVRLSLRSGATCVVYTRTLLYSACYVCAFDIQQPSIEYNYEFAEHGEEIYVRESFQGDIALLLAKWMDTPESAKTELFKEHLCYELALFVRLHDKPFWESRGAAMFKQRHAATSVVSAFIVERLAAGAFNFFAANPIEQFVMALAGAATEQQKELFIRKCMTVQPSGYDEIQSLLKGAGAGDGKASDKVIYETRASVSEEQGWYGFSGTRQPLFQYCRLFANILQGNVVAPDFLRMCANQRDFLLALLWNHKWHVASRESAISYNSKLQVKLFAGHGVHAIRGYMNSVRLALTAAENMELSVRHSVRGALVLKEVVVENFKVYSQCTFELASVFVYHDFAVYVEIFCAGGMIYQNEFSIEAVSTEELDLEKQLMDALQDSATSCSAQAAFEVFLARFSRLSPAAFARCVVQTGMSDAELEKLYVCLFNAGIFNPYLLNRISSEPLRWYARYLAFRETLLFKTLSYPLIDQCPAVVNRVLTKKRALAGPAAYFVVRALFSGEVSELFFYLVKHGYLQAAEALYGRISKAPRFDPVRKYFRAMVYGEPYQYGVHFNRFNAQGAARSYRVTTIQQFTYSFENGVLTLQNVQGSVQLLAQQWKYGKATEERTLESGVFELPQLTRGALLYQNQVYLLENLKTGVSWSRSGTMLRLWQRGLPAVGLLVVERQRGDIVRATYSDFRGYALVRGDTEIEVFESLEKSVVVK